MERKLRATFASQSETQGMVLTEAMVAGCPVVGGEAPGVREVVEDGKNGGLLATQRLETFAAAPGKNNREASRQPMLRRDESE